MTNWNNNNLRSISEYELDLQCLESNRMGKLKFNITEQKDDNDKEILTGLKIIAFLAIIGFVIHRVIKFFFTR